jgi:hypothetical protein
MTLALMVRETIASETSILNDTITMQNSIENSTQSNVTGSKNFENITETNQTGSISGRISSLGSPSLEGNCTVC